MSSPKSVPQSSAMKTGSGMRHLSDKELQEKRSKGLCFKCDEKWYMGHRCKRRELSVLLIEGDEEEGTKYAGSDPPISPTDETSHEVIIQPGVSLNSVVGLTNPKTMKLKGVVRGAK